MIIFVTSLFKPKLKIKARRRNKVDTIKVTTQHVFLKIKMYSIRDKEMHLRTYINQLTKNIIK